MVARPVVLVLALLLGGCVADAGEQVVVFAASSLADAFEELAGDFEATHPGSDVVLQLAGSQTLVQQLAEGAPADVLATADRDRYAAAVAGGSAVGPGTAFATTPLVLAVAPGNPLGVRDVTDLGREDLVVVLAAAEVPAGARTAALLAQAGVRVAADSYELSVRAALARVEAGEADVAVVYATDVAAAGDRVAAVATGLPPTPATTATYVVGPTRTPGDADLARAFVDHVTGPAGRAVLDAHGFGPP